ncbi:rod shape-determining protein MreC [Paucimonas lemoignei]|uniref:Cell shape-determining protein MreC n=1 Tax=Paucimonas lemoignei TaxID=29443 RepID=A0A4R3HYW7_PAULE|nr:rod shape-determining protein MreC [Paucimonas lemoignei]
MEYSPPPLFKQGASARAKVVIFSLIAIFLLVADARWHTLGAIRQVVGTALYPLQRLALTPRDAAFAVGDYFSSLSRLQQENRKYMQQQVANAQALQQSQLLAAENAHLRSLLGASERLEVKSLMAEILYDARDPFTRKIVLDRGSQQGVKPGQPVIDDTGVVGQVTRVFPFTAEATLLTDKDQSIPVQVVRSGLRSVAYGRGQSGVMDLRFMPANADIRKGDILVTSGLDGIYPAGLAVAKVTEVEHKSSDAFAKIVCLPAAGIDRHRQLLILLTEYQPPQRTQAAAPAGADAKSPAKPADKAADKAAPAKAAEGAAAKQDAKPAAKPDAKPAEKATDKPAAQSAPKTAAQPGGATANPAANIAKPVQKPAPANVAGAPVAPATSATQANKPAAQVAPAIPAAPANKPAPQVAPAKPATKPVTQPASAVPVAKAMPAPVFNPTAANLPANPVANPAVPAAPASQAAKPAALQRPQASGGTVPSGPTPTSLPLELR